MTRHDSWRFGRISSLGLLVLALSTAACVTGELPVRWSPGDAELPALEQGVLDELQAYYDDFSERDWEAYPTHFWPGATLVTIWQAEGEPEPRVFASSVPEFVAKAPEGPGSAPIFAEWMTAAELRVDEHGLAQAWVDYDAHFGEEGALFEWSGVDAFTLLRHDGRWRIVSLAYVSTK